MTTTQIDMHLTEAERQAELEADARTGLTAELKNLPPKYFYDARGSELFEEITRLAEYYPTRAERSILAADGATIARASGADTLVELGSGSSEKTRLLLDGLEESGRLRCYMPIDVSRTALEQAVETLGAAYPALDIHGVVADFERHLALLPDEGNRMVAFLGSTIGNLTPQRRLDFLTELRGRLRPGETLLLGADLVKDERRLVNAYDDASGVTAEFNRNVLRVLNRRLGADFDPDRFDHVAVWNPVEEWIEMRLRTREEMRVRMQVIGLTVDLARHEDIRTEISAKFRRERLEAELNQAGLRPEGWWTDPDGDYALALARRPEAVRT
jgi:L-histidine N-alpha-methyltransferase